MAPNRCVCPYGFTGAQCERGNGGRAARLSAPLILTPYSVCTLQLRLPLQPQWVPKPHV